MIAAAEATLSAREFERIRRLAYDYCGLSIEDGKEGLVAARLSRIMRAKGIGSYSLYYQHVVADKTLGALVEMIDHLTTNHTSFFREPQHFSFLETAVFPQLADRPAIRIWSAACSSGEEPYSIAISAAERLHEHASRIQILATDISTRVLAAAERGIYSKDRLQGLTPELQRRYLLKGSGPASGQYRIKPLLQQGLRFARLNLMEPFPSDLGSFSVILCRNAMIYFDLATQERLVNRFCRHLEPGGFLLIGHAESLHGIRHPLRFVQPATYQLSAPEPHRGSK